MKTTIKITFNKIYTKILHQSHTHTQKDHLIFFAPYLWDTVRNHTARQVVDECHSTYQRFEGGGTLVNLWVPQACVSNQRGDPLASLGGPWDDVAAAYQVWAPSPC